MLFALKENRVVSLDRIASRGRIFLRSAALGSLEGLPVDLLLRNCFSVSILCDHFRRISRRQANKDIKNSFAFLRIRTSVFTRFISYFYSN
jgi:hypothetical protein